MTLRRLSLAFQVFVSILLVALGTALTVGLFARSALSSAFDRYLSALPAGQGMMANRPRMGRVMLGGAEQTFIASVDKSVYLAALVAVCIAALVALSLAAYLNRPLRRLKTAAEALTQGDLARRVSVQGPAEVAVLGDAFNRMADSLEEGERLRRRLVGDVAHELRNPLAAARAQAEGMAEGVLAADAPRLESLVEDLLHLSVLVADLQELSIAEAGKLHYEMISTDLVPIVEREVLHARASGAPSMEVTAWGTDSPAIVLGDERRLAQVLRNLLSNAARHTSFGSIEVRLAREGGFITVSVVDTGEGIPPEDLPHIFDRFFRADSARASDTGGAGLGLAITKSIVRDHGGEPFASSEPGHGATIGFRIPLAPHG